MPKPDVKFWVIDVAEEVQKRVPRSRSGDEDDPTVTITITQKDFRNLGNYAPVILVGPKERPQVFGKAILDFLGKGVLVVHSDLIRDRPHIVNTCYQIWESLEPRIRDRYHAAILVTDSQWP